MNYKLRVFVENYAPKNNISHQYLSKDGTVVNYGKEFHSNPIDFIY